MKKLLTLALISITFLTTLKSQTTYDKVVIFGSDEEINTLFDSGHLHDHGTFRKNISYTTILKSNEIDAINSLGYHTEIIQKDMVSFYKERALKDLQKTTHAKNNSCATGSGQVDVNDKYDTPTNFALGSMGGYLTYQELLDNLDSMASKYPNLITLKSPIGTYTTHEGRSIFWVRISDNPNTDEAEPETFYSAVHHAREPAGLSQLVFYMWHLLENYATDPEIAYLINETEMYFVPVINPDGYIYNETIEPNGGGMWRKNRRNNGGSYGVDLNRNYSYNWGAAGVSTNPSQDTYLGPSAFSEPETQAIKWFCEQRDFQFALNAHTYGNLLLFPFGWDDNAFAADHTYFETYSNEMVLESKFSNIKSSDLYPAAGDSDDWMYDDDLATKPKIYALTPEIGTDDDGFWPVPSKIIPICKGTVLQNKLNAHLLKNYCTQSNNFPNRVLNNTGTIDYEIQRLGLESGDIIVSITPISNINITGPNITHTGMNLMDIETGSFTYSISTGIQFNDEIKFVINLDNGQWIKKDTIISSYGVPTTIFSDPANPSSEWTATPSNSWGPTTEEYVSPNTSLTDSPNSNYGNNTTTQLQYDNIIDLTDATTALIQYQTKWSIENNYDYVQFMVSTNNGNSWIPQCGQYTNLGTGNQDESQPLYDGEQNTWVEEEIDLSDYLGQQIRVKFKLVSDIYVAEDGFYFDDFKVLANFNTAIDEDELNIAFSLYPNPASTSVQINTHFQPNNNTLEIYNQMGQLIIKENISSTTSTIDISSLASGIYILSLKDENGKSKRKKLIINR